MQNELDILEQKLLQLVQVARHLRRENHQLRQELAAALSANRQSQDKIEQAAARLERLLNQIPDGAQ